MSGTRDLVDALKAELRRAGITYAQLARELGLAESSVKRILARGELSLARLDQILAVLRMDFSELARQVAAARPPRQQLTLEQERAVVADPKLLLVAICVLSQWTVDEMVRTYTLHKAQVVAALLALDRLGIVKLHAHDRYRLLIDKTLRWRPNGPVMQFFRTHAVGDYYDGGFDGEGEMLLLVHGQIQRAQAHAFNDRLQRLAQDFAHQHLADRALPAAEREAYTLVLGMRSWLFTPFRAMLREGGEAA